ncbi:MAG: hypothetical protein J4F36_03005 [Nitrosopumilaceae archaeon]|nr:hypothetical protein [Nitrosopumilaceae archaeon]
MAQAVCERCKQPAINAGDLTTYKNHGIDKLLCLACISEIDEYFAITCTKCGKPAHMRGNLLEYENQKVCPVCMDEIRIKEN